MNSYYHRGGSYSIGTKDREAVYLDRYTGDLGENGKPTGNLIFNMNMSPDEAREVANALIEKADELEEWNEVS